MFRRKIYEEMAAWKNTEGVEHKALVIRGLRHIGKTTVARRFAEENYENTVFIDLANDAYARNVFEGDFDIDRITFYLSADNPERRFVPGRTAIILDEVQECGNARACLKAFVEDGRYDVICTGSMMDIGGYYRRPNRGVPVGSEHMLRMEPMDFEEFLWARGMPDDVIGHIRQCILDRRPLPPSLHNTMLGIFREYLCVGGMPAAVETFLSTHDMNAVIGTQRSILDSCRNEFARFVDEEGIVKTDETLRKRIGTVLDSIPLQLSKGNRKFQYSVLDKGARANRFEPAVRWLCEYGLAVCCPRVETMCRPLYGNNSAFGLYLRDTGLFVSMLEDGTAGRILAGELGSYGSALFDNIVADAFTKNGRKLFYFARSSGLEIDFVTVIGGNVTLVEVRPTTGNSKASKEVLSHPEKYGVEHILKIGKDNISQEGNILTFPYYAAPFIELLDWGY